MSGLLSRARGRFEFNNASLRLAVQAEKHARLKDNEYLLAELDKRNAALESYADHQSWRCTYRSRYEKCVCGLDEAMEEFGLAPIEVQDPEASRELGRAQEAEQDL